MNPALQLTLTLGEDGRLNVQAGGPHAGNRLMVLGMLTMAQQALLAPTAAPDPGRQLLVARGALPQTNGGH